MFYSFSYTGISFEKKKKDKSLLIHSVPPVNFQMKLRKVSKKVE